MAYQHADQLVDRAAEAMTGTSEWATMDEAVRRQWRELARRAGAIFRPAIGSPEGQAVPDDALLVGATVALARHAGSLTTRKADDATRQIIARDLVKQLRLSGYRITYGAGAAPHSTPKSGLPADPAGPD